MSDAINKFEVAFLKAYTLNDLRRMMRRHLGMIVENELDVQKGFKYVVSDLMELSERGGWQEELIRGAVAESRNQALHLASKAVLPPAPTAPPPPPPEKSPDRVSLEKFVRERGGLMKWQDFRARLDALERQLCRVEVPTESPYGGTGWLVAPNLVLTNYHVAEPLLEKKIPASEVTCRFDFTSESSKGKEIGVRCKLAKQWCVDSSQYAASDATPGGAEPTADQLDYALLRLAKPIGDEAMPKRSGKRGWVQVSASPPVVMGGDIVIVPQFPDGRPLEVAFGAALQYNTGGTRLRHDANTDFGSSGSPCLTATLEPFGLHHASGLTEGERYNLCIPLRQIIKRMEKTALKGASAFWLP